MRPIAGFRTNRRSSRDALTRAGAGVALPLLLRVIERVREREASEPASRGAEWIKVRARAHVTLAGRGSRIALYDLRESIEAAASPLPVEFLSALSTAGDASCLEAVAAAYVRSTPTAGPPEPRGPQPQRRSLVARSSGRRLPDHRPAGAAHPPTRGGEEDRETVGKRAGGSLGGGREGRESRFARLVRLSQTRPRPGQADRSGRTARMERHPPTACCESWPACRS